MADIVERLRMLHALTTPGEWKEDAYQDHWGHGRLLLGHSGKGTYVCHVVTDISAKTRATTTKYQGVRFANLAFIAAAHNELPALLSEHDRQREEIERLTHRSAIIESALSGLFILMDEADDALDKDTYEQFRKDEFDPPNDADYSVCAGTVIKCNRVFNAIEGFRRDGVIPRSALSDTTAVEGKDG